HRLQKVRLSLAVGAGDDRQLFAGIKACALDVAEVGQDELFQPHGAQRPWPMATVRPSRVTVSPARSFLPRMVHASPFTCTWPFWMSSFASPPVSTRPASLSRLSSLMYSV